MAQSARLNLRMQKELKLLLTDPPPGVSILPLSDGLNSSASSLTNIEARIEGPEGTVYSNGVFTIRIQIPERYPFHPPNVTFVTPIYHPNIDNGGRICMDILNLPPKGGWQPSLNIATVLTSIGLLLSEPNPDDGLMCEASREYKYNRQVFDEKARSWTDKFAKPGTSGSIKDSGSVASASKMGEAFVDEQRGKESEESVSENEGFRKSLRHISEKLSLSTAATAEKNSNDNENVAPFCCSLPPQPGKASIQLAHPKSIKHTEASSEHTREHDRLMNDFYRKQKQLEECSKSTDMIIVLDSEDSDDEVNPVKRSRLSLLRKRIVKG